MEDREIIELFFARDEQAIAALREKYGAHALALARSVTGSDQDAEECLSDACFSLWSAIPPAHPLHLGAYLLSTVRNGALTRLRAGMAAKRGGGCLEETYDELSEFLAAPDTPEQTLEAKELAREVERFLSRLSHDDRVIFMRRYWLVSPLEEIARSLGCSPGRVKSSLHRSRAKLQKYLKKEGYL